MARLCYNHRPLADQQHHLGEIQKTDSHETAEHNKVKQPAEKKENQITYKDARKHITKQRPNA